MKLTELTESITLLESTVRTPHPEDSVFKGFDEVQNVVGSLYWVIENPRTISIKWDGFPALIFGYNSDGQFTISDKYMFDKGEQYLGTSPKFWQEYDRSRGKDRGELYQKLVNIWDGLKQAVGNSTGFFWGDLLWGFPLKAQNNMLIFKPNTVTYSVPVNSNLGKRINNTSGGIVVHQYFRTIHSKPVPWNGQGLKSNEKVAILTPNAGLSFTLQKPTKLITKVNQALQENKNLDEFLSGLAGVVKTAILKYLSQYSTKQTNLKLSEWLPKQLSAKQNVFLFGEDGYLNKHQKELQSLMDLYFAIAELKNNLVEQLEQQVQGIQQTINGVPGGEGFVFNTPNGLIKLVNRGKFGAAHFAKK
jgi:hypothetical protein